MADKIRSVSEQARVKMRKRAEQSLKELINDIALASPGVRQQLKDALGIEAGKGEKENLE